MDTSNYQRTADRGPKLSARGHLKGRTMDVFLFDFPSSMSHLYSNWILHKDENDSVPVVVGDVIIFMAPYTVAVLNSLTSIRNEMAHFMLFPSLTGEEWPPI